MAKVRPLPPLLAEAAKKELNEDPERLEADLKHLRDWLAKQPHLNARTDDQFLVSFLRASKSSLERAKEKIDHYYSLRSAVPEFFYNRNPSTPIIQNLVKLGQYLPLGVDKEGRRVVLIRAGLDDPQADDIADMFKLNMMLTDIMLLEDDHIVVKGQVTVIDMERLTLAHAVGMTSSIIQKIMSVIQVGYPIRTKGFHYLNVGTAFERIISIVKGCMSEKLKERMKIHASLASLYDSVPKEILPEEYGGDAGPLEEIADRWANKLMEWKQYFLEDAQYGVDESKRPGLPKTQEILFGIDGSFRPLNVN